MNKKEHEIRKELREFCEKGSSRKVFEVVESLKGYGLTDKEILEEVLMFLKKGMGDEKSST